MVALRIVFTMELKQTHPLRLELPDDILREFYCDKLPKGFDPAVSELSLGSKLASPELFTIDLLKGLAWLDDKGFRKSLSKEVCDIPVLLYTPDFSPDHLLFHYDGSSGSTDRIKQFVSGFGSLIQGSKATIISPSFIPKSKIREEQEVIELVAAATRETSFIKFNFTKIGDFWSYGIKHDCTLLITAKSYQADLAEILLHFYKGKSWSDVLSFYISV